MEDTDQEEEISTEEIASIAYNRLDALIQVLIKKKILTEEEIDTAEEALYTDEQ